MKQIFLFLLWTKRWYNSYWDPLPIFFALFVSRFESERTKKLQYFPRNWLRYVNDVFCDIPCKKIKCQNRNENWFGTGCVSLSQGGSFVTIFFDICQRYSLTLIWVLYWNWIIKKSFCPPFGILILIAIFWNHHFETPILKPAYWLYLKFFTVHLQDVLLKTSVHQFSIKSDQKQKFRASFWGVYIEFINFHTYS